MDVARVIGTVWCTVKDPSMEGLRFALVQPLNQRPEPIGEPAVAVDALNRPAGDLVYLVRSGDAAFGHHGTHDLPCDCAIAGQVDDLYVPEAQR